ncbi:MAG TPA: hypothetical protein VFY12_03375 [Arenimonas sp.]|nr:hypothetical protein [Arenimonas sp.]
MTKSNSTGRRIFAAALMGLLLLPLSASAREFLVGVENTQLYPIFGHRMGQYRGFSRELLDAFAARKGYTFKYVGRTVPRLYGEFLDEELFDFKYPDSASWRAGQKAGKSITYSAPVYSGIEATMVLPNRVGKPQSSIKTLGIIRGFQLRPYRKEIADGLIKQVESDNLPNLINNALNARVDAILVHQQVANHYLSQNLKRPGGLVVDPSLPSNVVDYKLSTLKHPDVIAEFDEFLASEIELIARLKSKYQLD